MSTATVAPERPYPFAEEARPPALWLMPAVAIPVTAVAFLMRRRMRRRGQAATPTVDWSLLSRNSITFSPRVNFHPTLRSLSRRQLGGPRRRRLFRR